MDSRRQGTQRSTEEMGKSESNPEALRTRERKNTTEKVFGRAMRCLGRKAESLARVMLFVLDRKTQGGPSLPLFP